MTGSVAREIVWSLQILYSYSACVVELYDKSYIKNIGITAKCHPKSHISLV